MIDSDARDHFWRIVEECLVTIHGLSESEARRKSAALRERLELPPSGIASDIFYHAEPFDVACDIANNAQELSQYREKYNAILRRHQW